MNENSNVLLTKTHVGQVRPSYHRLPPKTFTYGKITEKDNEGACDIVNSWKYHEKSPVPKKEHSFIISNSLSVIKGLSKASDFSRLRKTSLEVFKNRSNNTQSPNKPFDYTYGVPMKPPTPIDAVLKHFYMNPGQKNEQNLVKKPEKFVKLNPLFKNKPVQPENIEKQVFKIKKFQNVSGKAKCWDEN